MPSLDSIYTYVTPSGVVIPQYEKAREFAVSAFKEVFGPDIDTSEETVVGRLIESYATMFMMCMKVAAQNAGNFNPRIAIGGYLDNIGALFGIDRADGELDNAYRQRILSSQSIGIGYEQSIRRALSEIAGFKSCVVLENGYDVTVVKNGIALKPHSIFVCVEGGTDNDVASAIYRTKSAGCDYTDNVPSFSPVSIDVVDGSSSTTVKFYRPQKKTVNIQCVVNGSGYTGADIASDTARLIADAFSQHASSGSVIYDTDIVASVAATGNGIAIRILTFNVDGIASRSVDLLPYEVAELGTITTAVTY